MHDKHGETHVPETVRPVAHDDPRVDSPGELRIEKFVSRPSVGLGLGIGAMLALVAAMLVWLMRPLPVTDLTGAAAPGVGGRLFESPEAMGGTMPRDSPRAAEARSILSALAQSAVLTCAGMDSLGSDVGVIVDVEADGVVTNARVSGGVGEPERVACIERELRGAQLPAAWATATSVEQTVRIPLPGE